MALPHEKLFRFHRPIGRYFRRTRLRTFWSAFRLTAESLVVDVGGYGYYWRFLDPAPRVVIVNLEPPREAVPGIDWVVADGACLPFRDEAADVVFANSVIEHVLGAEKRHAFAREVERVGRQYYVQTPNRWFPVETHLMTPFIHFAPRSWRGGLVRNFTLWGWLARPSRREAEDFLDLTELLGEGDLVALFPKAEIWREKILGMTKSLIAVSRGDRA